MPTLAALLGHSKLNMVMRYAHPQEHHQADAMKKLIENPAVSGINWSDESQVANSVLPPLVYRL